MRTNVQYSFRLSIAGTNWKSNIGVMAEELEHRLLAA
jgi:hypothetical protein